MDAFPAMISEGFVVSDPAEKRETGAESGLLHLLSALSPQHGRIEPAKKQPLPS